MTFLKYIFKTFTFSLNGNVMPDWLREWSSVSLEKYKKFVDTPSNSATPIAKRCIKLSTQPCNLHRQTLAVEWPY